ncbi:MAG: insulinase family protein [Muribaculaceae bacterium]|nr:insulinase family protein [Muribaculaceae bacterium]
MTTKNFIISALLYMLCLLSAYAGTALPINESVRIGKLDNGLTYYLCHNDYPENRVSFYLPMRVGSMQEEDNQNGLAHFLEHMAFNGSEHFDGKGKSIRDYLQSIGVSDANAYTALTSTIYYINDVPSTRQHALDSCLIILKDWAHGILLTDEEVEKERGVIREEWRLAQSAEWRIGNQMGPTVYSASKYGYRNIIGTREIIDNFPPQLLRDYYEMWYRPDNQAVIVVGDIDVDNMESRIRRVFTDLPLSENAPQVINGFVPDNDNPIVAVGKDEKLQNDRLQIIFKRRHNSHERKDTYGYYQDSYIREMVSEMFSQRLTEKCQDKDCPYVWAVAGDCDFPTKDNEAFGLDCFPKSGEHLQALQELVAETMRVEKYGFTESEYSLKKKEYLSQIEQRYNNRNNISNTSIADGCCNHFIFNLPLLSIEQEYHLAKETADNITLETINRRFPELIHFDGKDLVITCYIKNDEQSDSTTADDVLHAIRAAQSSSMAEAYQNEDIPENLMTALPPRGAIVNEYYNDALGFVELELSNGAKVILKPTDNNEDYILMRAYQQGGRSAYDEKDRANLFLFGSVVNSSGKGAFSQLQLQKALAGKNVKVNSYIYNFEDYVTASSSRKDLETMFQLTYLQFTAINRDDNSFNKIINYYKNLYQNGEPHSITEYMDTIKYIASGNHWLLKSLSGEDFQHVDYDRILEIARERTANAGNYTFIFAGSFDEKSIRPLIEQYIASLPSGKDANSRWGEQDIYPDDQIINHFTQEMETPKGYVYFERRNASMAYNLEHQIQANILGQVLLNKYRERIREDAGSAYMVSTVGWCHRNGNDSCTGIHVYIPVNPDYCDQALEIIKEEMNNACQTIDEQTIDGIKKSLIAEHEHQVVKDNYWIDCIQYYKMYDIDVHTHYDELVNAQTSEKITDFARQLISASNSVEVVITPK